MIDNNENRDGYLKTTKGLVNQYLIDLEKKDLPKWHKDYISVSTSHLILNNYYIFVRDFLVKMEKENGE